MYTYILCKQGFLISIYIYVVFPCWYDSVREKIYRILHIAAVVIVAAPAATPAVTTFLVSVV